MEETTNMVTEKMEAATSHLSGELTTIRSGRASAALLEKIKVDYYGTLTPVNQMANISVPEPRLIVVQPWDTSQIPEIEKAIMSSDLGVTPSNDGKIIRISFPQLTEDRRKELVKLSKRIGEETKIQIRNYRRNGNDDIKTLKTNGDVSEDDAKKAQDKIQKITDSFIKKIDELLAKKEHEILEI